MESAHNYGASPFYGRIVAPRISPKQ